MAKKDNRKILSSIAFERTEAGKGRVYRPEDEDDLERDASPEQLRRFLDSGAIEGDWKKAAPAPKSTTKAK
jgi:hypothetical protein